MQRPASGRMGVQTILALMFGVLVCTFVAALLASEMTKTRMIKQIMSAQEQQSLRSTDGSDPSAVMSMCKDLVQEHVGDKKVCPECPECPKAQDCPTCPVCEAQKPAECPPQEPCPACPAGGAAAPAAVEPAGATAEDNKFLLEFPENIKSVIINIGTNFNPVRPPADDESCVVIAVEPIVETINRIEKHPRLWILAAAIASGTGRFQTMQIHNVGGASSSLAKPSNQKAFWVGPKAGDNMPSFAVVPVMPMLALLNAIPRHIHIKHLKTDMQGFDFDAVSSAGRQIRRIPNIYAEVWVGTNSYEGVKNDLNRDWIPHMEAMGYRKVTKVQKGRGEDNAEWERIGDDDTA